MKPTEPISFMTKAFITPPLSEDHPFELPQYGKHGRVDITPLMSGRTEPNCG